MATFYAINPTGTVMGVGNYPDEVAEFIDRFTGSNRSKTIWSVSGQQVEISNGEPTGWRVMREVMPSGD